jgi:hypothetical protein
MFVFFTPTPEILGFHETVQKHIDCRNHAKKMLDFLTIINMFFMEEIYAPGSRIEFPTEKKLTRPIKASNGMSYTRDAYFSSYMLSKFI